MSRSGREALDALLERRDLTEDAAYELMVSLTDPAMAPAMTGALLAALRIKGATAAEVRGFARAMRSLARRPGIPVDAPVADVVGTGGDGSHSLNLSTGAALLAAACGVRVAKHGNRSVSSRCGSADVLEALGLALPLDERAAGECLDRTGFTFLFAPHYHPAMKAIAPVRQALGVRTIFNLLGPLSNPAQAPYALIGAWSLDIAELMAETLAGMPIRRMFVVCGDTGWDEPTPATPFTLFDVGPGTVRRSRRSAADFGLPACRAEELVGGDAAHNARRLAAVLRGAEAGGHRDALAMGAALVCEVTGLADGPCEGARLAAAAIDDGRAARLLDAISAPARERSA
jgi:anthranilate phosphoribosyltransferase